MNGYKAFLPETLGPGKFYRFLISAVIPRPIAFISTESLDGNRNLAPFSFFNALSSNPPTLAVSFTLKRDGSIKDSLKNIRETGQFVVNSSDSAFVEALNRTSEEFPYGVDEMSQVGLTPIASQKVRPPRVAESSWSFECQLEKEVQIGEAGTRGSSVLVIGKILLAHARADILDPEELIDPRRFHPIARLGGALYAELGPLLEIKRPE